MYWLLSHLDLAIDLKGSEFKIYRGVHLVNNDL
jgi:hypothetical protein